MASFFWFTYEYYFIAYVYMYLHMYTHTHAHHMFFTHSPIYRHLGRFYILATVDNAAVNTEGRQIPFRDSDFTSFEYMRASGMLDHMVVLFWISWGEFYTVSLVAAPVRIPDSAQGFPFLHILVDTR